jgi:hypothetical protein
LQCTAGQVGARPDLEPEFPYAVQALPPPPRPAEPLAPPGRPPHTAPTHLEGRHDPDCRAGVGHRGVRGRRCAWRGRRARAGRRGGLVLGRCVHIHTPAAVRRPHTPPPAGMHAAVRFRRAAPTWNRRFIVCLSQRACTPPTTAVAWQRIVVAAIGVAACHRRSSQCQCTWPDAQC